MSSITVHRLDPELKECLHLRAVRHRHAMEAEVRLVLLASLFQPVSGEDPISTSGFMPALPSLGVF